jgi:glycosyltransferase involved in cell wall biosynthesis
MSLSSGSSRARLENLFTLDEEQAETLRVLSIGEAPRWLAFPEAAAELDGVDVLSASAASLAARQFVNGNRPSVLHATRASLGSLGEIRAALPQVPLVLDLTREGDAVLGWRAARQVGVADLILVGTLWELRELRRRYPSLMSRTRLCRSPLDLTEYAPIESFSDERRESFERFRRSHDLGIPVVLFAGPYTRAGGLDLAVQAVASMIPRNPHVLLAAVRHGSFDAGFFRACERSAAVLGPRAVLSSSTPPDELAFWYAAADVVCAPYREPAGSTCARYAAAAGTPLVGTEVEPLLEHVVDGSTGFLVGYDDREMLGAALEALLGDPEEAARLGVAARSTAENEFSPRAAAGRLRRLWFEAANRRPLWRLRR